MLNWLRRLFAAPLLLLALIFAVGTVRMFMHDLPDSSVGGGVFAGIAAAASAGGASLLLRPDFRRWQTPSWAAFRNWACFNPLGQAALTYLVALALMAVSPRYQLLPGFLAFCGYCLAAAMTAAMSRQWWKDAGLSLLGWLLLFFALAATSEALAPRGFGEAGMVFLLPIMGFPVLLALSGVIRLARRNS